MPHDAKITFEQFKKIADEMERKSAHNILNWAIDTYGLRIGLASSFGAEDSCSYRYDGKYQ